MSGLQCPATIEVNGNAVRCLNSAHHEKSKNGELPHRIYTHDSILVTWYGPSQGLQLTRDESGRKER
ncbi:MAG: hypothetical protein WC538_22235 [Thermoanaerobaculia bacterium]